MPSLSITTTPADITAIGQITVSVQGQEYTNPSGPIEITPGSEVSISVETNDDVGWEWTGWGGQHVRQVVGVGYFNDENPPTYTMGDGEYKISSTWEESEDDDDTTDTSGDETSMVRVNSITVTDIASGVPYNTIANGFGTLTVSTPMSNVDISEHHGLLPLPNPPFTVDIGDAVELDASNLNPGYQFTNWDISDIEYENYEEDATNHLLVLTFRQKEMFLLLILVQHLRR